MLFYLLYYSIISQQHWKGEKEARNTLFNEYQILMDATNDWVTEKIRIKFEFRKDANFSNLNDNILNIY